MQHSRTTERSKSRGKASSPTVNKTSFSPSFRIPWFLTTSLVSSTMPDTTSHDQERRREFSAHSHDLPPRRAKNQTFQWLVAIFALPPIGSLFFGTAKDWSDGITMILIGVYLCYLTKVPWEVYHSIQASIAVRRAALVNPQQKAALANLHRQEFFCLCGALAAPLFGGCSLFLIGPYLSIANYLTPSNIILYILAASLRPLYYLKRLIQERAFEMQDDLDWVDTDTVKIRRRLDQLELSLHEVHLACATEHDIENFKSEVRMILDRIAQYGKQQEQREKRAHQEAATRIKTAEGRVSEVEAWCELQQDQTSPSSATRFIWKPVNLFRETVGGKRMPSPSSGDDIVRDT